MKEDQHSAEIQQGQTGHALTDEQGREVARGVGHAGGRDEPDNATGALTSPTGTAEGEWRNPSPECGPVNHTSGRTCSASSTPQRQAEESSLWTWMPVRVWTALCAWMAFLLNVVKAADDVRGGLFRPEELGGKSRHRPREMTTEERVRYMIKKKERVAVIYNKSSRSVTLDIWLAPEQEVAKERHVHKGVDIGAHADAAYAGAGGGVQAAWKWSEDVRKGAQGGSQRDRSVLIARGTARKEYVPGEACLAVDVSLPLLALGHFSLLTKKPIKGARLPAGYVLVIDDGDLQV